VALVPFVQAVLAVGSAAQAQAPPDPVVALTARQKAALVVVSGLPAPKGVAGVIVRRWDRTEPRPPGALVFVDQEGGAVRAYPGLPASMSAAAYVSRRQATSAGRAAGRALRRAGVHVDLAPVVDLSGGPLGSRHFRNPQLAVAFARGLESSRTASCPKHFPGLGTAPVSTDDDPHVPARVLRRELGAFGASIRAGARCVMVSHGFYSRFGERRAVTAPRAYRLLRRLGFDGVAITDSLSIVRGPWPVRWARSAALAGADLLLFTSPEDARRALRALVPLARQGRLDPAVRRVLRLRRSVGLPPVSGW
jgi:beta-N-acetylhexosaminidase